MKEDKDLKFERAFPPTVYENERDSTVAGIYNQALSREQAVVAIDYLVQQERLKALLFARDCIMDDEKAIDLIDEEIWRIKNGD